MQSNTPVNKKEANPCTKWLDLPSDLSREIAVYLGYRDFCKTSRVCRGGGFFRASPSDTLLRILQQPQLNFEFPDDPDNKDWQRIKDLKKQDDLFNRICGQNKLKLELSRKTYKLKERIEVYEWNRNKIFAKIIVCAFLCRFVCDNSSELIIAFMIPFLLPILKYQFNVLQSQETELHFARNELNTQRLVLNLLSENMENEEIKKTLNRPKEVLKKYGIKKSGYIDIDTCHYLFAWLTGHFQMPHLKLNQLNNIAKVCIKNPALKNHLGECLIINLMNIINTFEPRELTSAQYIIIFRNLMHHFPTKTDEEKFLLKQFLLLLVEKSAGKINANMTLRYRRQDRFFKDILVDRNFYNRAANDPIYEILDEVLNSSSLTEQRRFR